MIQVIVEAARVVYPPLILCSCSSEYGTIVMVVIIEAPTVIDPPLGSVIYTIGKQESRFGWVLLFGSSHGSGYACPAVFCGRSPERGALGSCRLVLTVGNVAAFEEIAVVR